MSAGRKLAIEALEELDDHHSAWLLLSEESVVFNTNHPERNHDPMTAKAGLALRMLREELQEESDLIVDLFSHLGGLVDAIRDGATVEELELGEAEELLRRAKSHMPWPRPPR